MPKFAVIYDYKGNTYHAARIAPCAISCKRQMLKEIGENKANMIEAVKLLDIVKVNNDTEVFKVWSEHIEDRGVS